MGQPNNDQGDSRDLTQNDRDNAAQAAGTTPNAVAGGQVPSPTDEYAQAATGTPSGAGAATGAPGMGPGGQTPVGTVNSGSSEDALNRKMSDAAMGSNTKPADAGQTESTGSDQTGNTGS